MSQALCQETKAVDGNAAGLSPQALFRMGRDARLAARAAALAPAKVKNQALRGAAMAIRDCCDAILAANRLDVADARARGAAAAFLDRLTLDPARVEAMARGVEEIADLPDPVGRVLARFERPNGLIIERVATPLGVIGVIYESRPNVTADAGALCLKAGNAAILRGGSEGLRSSRAIHSALVAGLIEAGLPPATISLVDTTDRAAVGAMLAGLDGAIDVIVPRGGKSLVARVQEEARVPVFAHLEGIVHVYVHRDADLDMAADAAVSAAYGSAGERCMAISVLLAHETIADSLISKISDRIPNIKVGPGDEPGNEMGPLITGEHRDKVAGYVERAPKEGAKVVVDGRDGSPKDGFFLKPSLIDNVKPGMSCYDDEIFGPVLSVVRVGSYDEGVNLINSNQYGNGTAIFTRDGGVARQFQFDISVGMVGINVPIPVPVSYYSFGGWKASLFGDQHMYGPEGINFFTRSKVVTSRWPDPRTSKVDLGFPQNR